MFSKCFTFPPNEHEYIKMCAQKAENIRLSFEMNPKLIGICLAWFQIFGIWLRFVFVMFEGYLPRHHSLFWVFTLGVLQLSVIVTC